jgi:hypothetical protein
MEDFFQMGIFFGSTRVWTQGLMFARQPLYQSGRLFF